MLLYSSNGPISISADRVIFVTREHAPGRYALCTLVLDDGTEVHGIALKDALSKLEAKLEAAA
jgi:hypothetical protein